MWHDRRLPDGLIAKAELEKPKRKISRDFFSLNAGFVGTSEFSTILTGNDIRTTVRLHPCDIFYHTGEKVDQIFYFLEFDCWVDAFDYENSNFTVDSECDDKKTAPVITSCTRLSILEEKVKHLDLFFLENGGFFNPIVSEHFFLEIRKRKIRGISLIPIENYTWSE